jgi:TRAP-type C4-dicarboxylate transport system permease small subunit
MGLGMRTLLLWLHRGSAVIAGVLLVMIAILTLIQIGARMLGVAAHSYDEFATFCMAGATFMGLGYAWRTSAHIRMDLLVRKLSGLPRRILETSALFIMLAAVSYMTWHLIDMVMLSREMNDLSQGLVPIPLWIPQVSLALGSAMLTLAIAESLFDTLFVSAGLTASDNHDSLARAVGEV